MSNRMKKTAFRSSYVFAKYFSLLVQAHVGTPAGKCRAGGSGGVPGICTSLPCWCRGLVTPARAAWEAGCPRACVRGGGGGQEVGASHASAMKSASYWDITGVCAVAGLTLPPQGSSHQEHTEIDHEAPFYFFLLFS